MTCEKYECRMRGIERDQYSDRVMELEAVLERIRNNPASDSGGVVSNDNNWVAWAKKVATEALYGL